MGLSLLPTFGSPAALDHGRAPTSWLPFFAGRTGRTGRTGCAHGSLVFCREIHEKRSLFLHVFTKNTIGILRQGGHRNSCSFMFFAKKTIGILRQGGHRNSCSSCFFMFFAKITIVISRQGGSPKFMILHALLCLFG